MKLMDCGVFPSRAEGWNLEILEMMSCGKHIITTDVTGHTEFCDQYNSSLIYPDCMETAFDGQFFYGQGEWYTIEDEHVDQIAEFMYYDIHIPKQENKLKQNKEGIKTAKQFTWEHSAKKLYDILNSILEK
jgi:glycosyltransferase involved in cell wall biosynthesis